MLNQKILDFMVVWRMIKMLQRIKDLFSKQEEEDYSCVEGDVFAIGDCIEPEFKVIDVNRDGWTYSFKVPKLMDIHMEDNVKIYGENLREYRNQEVVRFTNYGKSNFEKIKWDFNPKGLFENREVRLGNIA